MNEEAVYNLSMNEQRKVYDTLIAVKDWFDRFGEHAPIQFGDEAKLAKQVHESISLLEKYITERNLLS